MNRMSGLLVLSALMMLTTQTFAYGYGYSKIVLNQSSITISPGGYGKIAYTVTLYNQSAGPSNLNLQNTIALIYQGVNGSLTTSSGVPPFSGVLSIHPSPGTTPGSTYTLVLNVTGYDPSVATANVLLTIGQAGTTSASTTTPVGGVTTTAGYSTSTAASGGSGYGSGGTSGGSSSTTTYAIVAVVVIVIVAAGYMFLMKGKGKK